MGTMSGERFYITTPIYYVNDAPHVGHCYTTVVADCVARYGRLGGRDVFFLTGTDEHAEKVETAAAERGVGVREWADRNAQRFERAFDFLSCSPDDFIRTSQSRHTRFVEGAIERLMASGDIELGTYEGWFDPSQEEYLTESAARASGYVSPVTGRELVKRAEENYFFRLSRYQERLLAHFEAEPGFVRPEARRNEILNRIREGLQDVPVSRAVKDGEGGADSGWGIRMPGDEGHRVYVWIDALFNYLSAVRGEGVAGGGDAAAVAALDRSGYWPARVHLIAKDILWFHAVIWPALLMALDEELPGCVYTHSYWVREGRKMSKSLGNFLDLPTLEAYAERFGVDALRYYLLTNGPVGVTDSDFAYEHFVEVYNADLANGIGNAHSRVTNMIAKYFEGKVPEPDEALGGKAADLGVDWRRVAGEASGGAVELALSMDPAGAIARARAVSDEVDRFVNETKPFKLAKEGGRMGEVGTILYQCAEALRVACTLLGPAMPDTMAVAIERLGFTVDGTDSFESLVRWGRLEPGKRVTKGEALFPRADAQDPPPDGGVAGGAGGVAGEGGVL